MTDLDLQTQADEMARALNAIVDMAQPCSPEAEEISRSDPIRGAGSTWNIEFRKAQRLALVTLRKCGRRVE